MNEYCVEVKTRAARILDSNAVQVRTEQSYSYGSLRCARCLLGSRVVVLLVFMAESHEVHGLNICHL